MVLTYSRFVISFLRIVPNLSTNALGWPKKECTMNWEALWVALLAGALFAACLTISVFIPKVVSCLKRIADALEKEPTRYYTQTFVVSFGNNWDDMEKRLEEFDDEVDDILKGARIHSIQDTIVDVGSPDNKRLYRTVLYSLPSLFS